LVRRYFRVAFVPVKPAEFVVLQTRRQAGQTASQGVAQMPPPQFKANTSGFDPYKNYRFKEMARQLRRRNQQGQRVEALDRGGEAPFRG
jgi:hypothetical protein